MAPVSALSATTFGCDEHRNAKDVSRQLVAGLKSCRMNNLLHSESHLLYGRGEEMESYLLPIYSGVGPALTQPTIQSRSDEAARIAPADDLARFHLAAIVDSSDDAIISKNLNGIVTTWNAGAQRLFGYTAEEMIGQSTLPLIPKELQSEEDAILGKVRAGERIEHYETKEVTKNGQTVEISSTISPVRNAAGQVIGASKIARDISERRRLDETRVRLAAIVDSADDAIISKDLNGIISSWNEGARRMFGYTSEEMVGQPLLRLIPNDLHYEEAEILRKLRAGEKIDHFETTRLTKAGDPVDVSVTISPIRNRKGEVVGASKIARNISDRKRMEKILIQAEKIATTGRMAASIAHEINNPLEAVMNLIYLARQNREQPEKTLDYLLTAESELERVSHIARQTLGYYRDTGSPAAVFLHDLIENVLTVYNSKLIASSISVETTFSDLRKIVVSKGEMIQVFSNIIANSIDAMRDGGVLAISVHQTTALSAEGLEVVIRDQGIGISPEHLEKVFDPFFTTKGNLGTGIGLWVGRQLTERRGGQITVTSCIESGRSGTSVSIYVPFAHPTTAKTGE
jgi:PAS domain S-box-containing protein